LRKLRVYNFRGRIAIRREQTRGAEFGEGRESYLCWDSMSTEQTCHNFLTKRGAESVNAGSL
jgi:hypothetical protein